MENKIITLNNNEEYIVLKDAVIDNKRYIFCSKYDEKNEKIDENSFIIAELVLDGENLKLLDIKNQQLAETITKRFLYMMKN